jgi:carbonic anhydrase/acetyltransferase-like protein (isoleucine patch superfamily)
MLFTYKGIAPKLGKGVFVAEAAVVGGDVELGDYVSVWPMAVIRGDVNSIRIGAKTNVQDGAMLHVTFRKHPLVVGNGVIVAHAVVLHGCTIGDHVLLGIGCRVLDGAEVGEGSVVAAGAVVRQGMKVPPRSLVAGVPAVVKRPVSEAEYAEIMDNPNRYRKYVKSYEDSDMPYLLTPDDDAKE